MNIIAVGLTLLGAVHSVVSGGVRLKAPLGGNATIRCPYERGSETYPKYLTKGNPGTKNLLVRLDRRGLQTLDGRVSLKDDKELREFTVSIGNLSAEDAGQYWCGVDTWGWDTLTEVNLDIVQEVQEEVQGYPEPSNIKNDPKTPTQEGTSFLKGGHVLLGLSVAAAVVLVSGILTATFIITKRNKTKMATASADPENAPEPGRDSYIYEDVQNTSTAPADAHQSPDRGVDGTRALSQSVVYSCIERSEYRPESRPVPSPRSSPTVSIHYSTVRFIPRPSTEGSDPTDKPCDIYTTIQRL